jgi:hypothetical protein
MKATVLYRTAGILLFVAAAGHTYGLLNFWHAAEPMTPVHFPWGHTGYSYAQVVLGLGLFCSLCLLLGAYLAWHLGTLARTTPQSIGALGWVLFAYQLVGVCISFMCLSGPVRMIAIALAVCIGWAAWLSTSTPKVQLLQESPGPQ